MERIREIVIRGKTYEVKTDLSDEDLEKVVRLVNEALEESERVIDSPDFEMKSLMALLSLAEKAYFCEKKIDLTQRKIYSLIKRIEDL